MSGSAPAPFNGLRMFGYNMLMVDPPWPFEHHSERGEEKSFKAHYGEMSIDAIKALPVGQLAMAPAVLFLWCTSPIMPRAYEVLDAWGFRYGFTGTWDKRTRRGKTPMAPGYLHRGGAEFFIVGMLGKPKVAATRARNKIVGMVREHSRKPENAFAWCERYLPGAWRCELFSRASRKGWDTWGYEAGKFDPVVSTSPPSNVVEKIDTPAPAPAADVIPLFPERAA